jgi:hypothetical protein
MYEKQTKPNFFIFRAAEGTNLRTVLGNSGSNQISRLTETLMDCMSRRAYAEDLMPQTMDTHANEAVMAGNAPVITLNQTCIAAATVYAQMAALPGSLGSGLNPFRLWWHF